MSSMFQRLGKQTQQSQNPRDEALRLLQQQGISVPEGMENNPQALLQHVMQSGRVPQNRLSMAQQILQRMFRK